ncbi:hypothetical protein N2152v2_006391 [Parachlorella kessleri]
MSGQQLKLPVPVHIVTGALGAGKTTFLQGLLKAKPAGERWAVVVNEFGAVGIDQAVLQQSASDDGGGVSIRELAGGCMCCTLSGVTSVAIVQLLRATKPDRLWIEPSGLGHPAALVDVLRGEHLARALVLQPIICLVDCVQFRPARLPWGSQPALWASELCRDQVSIADVLVGSKADLGGREAVQAFKGWAGKLYPPKLKVLTASHGVIDSEAAGTTSTVAAAVTHSLKALSPVMSPPLATAVAASPAAAAATGDGDATATAAPADLQHPQPRSTSPAAKQPASGVPPQRSRGGNSSGGGSSTAGLVWMSNAPAVGPQPGAPVRKEARDEKLGMLACGWVFHPDDTFSQPRLQHFLDLAQGLVPRMKGVFRVSHKTWVAAAAGSAGHSVTASSSSSSSGGGTGVELQEIAYRRDSRLELILPFVAVGRDEGNGAVVAGGELNGPTSQTVDGGGLGGSCAGNVAVLACDQAHSTPERAAGAAVEPPTSPASSDGALDCARLAAALQTAQHGDWTTRHLAAAQGGSLVQYAVVGGLADTSAIQVLALNACNGTLTAAGKSAAGGRAPGFIAWQPGPGSVTQLFVANQASTAPDTGVTAVRWVQASPSTSSGSSGSIPALEAFSGSGSFVAGPYPAHVAVSLSGKWVFTANYNDGTVSVVPVKYSPASSGGGCGGRASEVTLGMPTTLPANQVGKNAHQVVLDPSGRFVYVPCLGADWVRAYKLDDNTGQLAPLTLPGTGNNTLLLPPGSGPRHLALHPTLSVAYVVNELSNTVAQLGWDSATGALSAGFAAQPQRIVSTLAPGTPAGCPVRQAATGCAVQAAAELVISADGRFLYASNRGSQGGKSSIAIFSISPGDGSLSPVGWGDGGGVVAFPRHISLTPCDTHLLLVASLPVVGIPVGDTELTGV